MMARGPKLTFYIDTVSPFGYEAYWILRNNPTFRTCDIEYIPVFLGGIMKACGNIAPITIRNKDKWIEVERLRWARRFRIPMAETLPVGFPPRTVGVMRALCALTVVEGGGEAEQGGLVRCLDGLLEEYWVRRRSVDEVGVFKEVFERVAGVEVTQRILELLPTEGKEVLIKNTDRALEDGAFGLPWIVAVNEKGEKEGFFGVDHLGLVVEFLGLEREKGDAWKSLL